MNSCSRSSMGPRARVYCGARLRSAVRKGDAEDHDILGRFADQHRAAGLGGKRVDQIGGGRARGDAFGSLAVGQRAAQFGVEDDPRPFDLDHDLQLPPIVFAADIQRAAAHQRLAGDQGEVEHHLQRGLGQRLRFHPPVELRALIVGKQALDRRLRLARVDLFAEAAGGTKGEAEEFELVGGYACALAEQLKDADAHLGIILVAEQLQPVVERADRRQQVMAQARAEQARKIDRADGHGGMLRPLPSSFRRTPESMDTVGKRWGAASAACVHGFRRSPE
ncbi:hypothetical protein WR25_23884 [Diploscapter pachys]|uniref:Uncharacterized protein n=1 Tax=Diploscapter pachys TaxID=2018661 RepID=A0A2A2M3W5_9BILA|nr:hypothetical protein WR25_23884 [Diploscapter pachys]